MPPEEEGVHKVPREPGGGAGEPEQGVDRGAQVAQGALLYDQDGLREMAASTAMQCHISLGVGVFGSWHKWHRRKGVLWDGLTIDGCCCFCCCCSLPSGDGEKGDKHFI